MKKERFDRLVESLGEVRSHVSGGRFAGCLSKVEVKAVTPPSRKRRPREERAAQTL